jgi:uncharacterized protein (UPF0248 family)
VKKEKSRGRIRPRKPLLWHLKKADEEFFVNIIKAGRESGVSKIQLDLGKEQITGLDITLNKIIEDRVIG